MSKTKEGEIHKYERSMHVINLVQAVGCVTRFIKECMGRGSAARVDWSTADIQQLRERWSGDDVNRPRITVWSHLWRSATRYILAARLSSLPTQITQPGLNGAFISATQMFPVISRLLPVWQTTNHCSFTTGRVSTSNITHHLMDFLYTKSYRIP